MKLLSVLSSQFPARHPELRWPCPSPMEAGACSPRSSRRGSAKPVEVLSAGLRRPAESAIRLLGEALKRSGIIHRQVGQDLAIQFHSALLEPVDELVVAHPVQFGSGADAHDP